MRLDFVFSGIFVRKKPQKIQQCNLYSQKKRGFTLVELLIAIVILGIVSVFAINTYQNTLLRAGRSAARLALTRLATAQELYYTDNQKYATKLEQLDTRLAGFASKNPAYVGSDGEFVENSSNAYYQITLTMGTNESYEYTLSAQATQKQVRDTPCSDWALDSEGVRSGKKNSATALTEAEIAACWGR